jgi:gamma-glutamylcyclotransferase (GGCT)/AIG2-like uncharacterized protein YtfP
MKLYFAFGSNLDADQMGDRCPGSQPRFRARLTEHRLAFTHLSRRWGGGAADIVPATGQRVWGLVYELEAHHLDLLDRYEGGYERIELQVYDDAHSAHQVTTYRVLNKGVFAPSRVYRDKILTWGERWSLPPGYLERLRHMRTSD